MVVNCNASKSCLGSGLKAKFLANGQSHVFKYFEELNEEEKQSFVDQLKAIPIDELEDLFKQATQEKSSIQETGIVPVLKSDVVKLEEFSADHGRWYEGGLEAIKAGKIAVITLAGGQGTRLGSSQPKGCFDIGLPSQKSLFQLQAERLLRLGQLTGKSIPWYIMTSGPTHDPTVSFFQSNNFFGLNRDHVHFFQQGVLPALSFDGKILLQSKGSVALAPDGNGGIYAALRRQGIIERLEAAGVQYVHMHSVDNCLVKMADPVFLGLCIERGIDCASKSVPKTNPKESVGILSRRNSDQKMFVAEYSELDPRLADATDDLTGELLFNTANIAIHMFSVEFLKRVCLDSHLRLPYHVAKKKIPSIDLVTGEPSITAGIKLEAFIFDVLEHATNPIILQVDRASEFAPLKNAAGSAPDDTPEACAARLYALHRRWLTRANALVLGDGPVEISPLVSYGGEGLEHLSGTVLNTPVSIERPIVKASL